MDILYFISSIVEKVALTQRERTRSNDYESSERRVDISRSRLVDIGLKSKKGKNNCVPSWEKFIC